MSETDMFCCRLQSQVDVDSGIETMEVDEVEMRQEAKRRRVSLCDIFKITICIYSHNFKYTTVIPKSCCRSMSCGHKDYGETSTQNCNLRWYFIILQSQILF